ncbi:hypothetical protein RN001_008161 [Aquatica leii]|uniref:Uncharacterized protein n=1 Tax=Aquatica leii TaxID=1421715 RepID=A0AAN7P3W4_9COLE|nr:hypothetical protein RN001_008161 [Aquatica leii]
MDDRVEKNVKQHQRWAPAPIPTENPWEKRKQQQQQHAVNPTTTQQKPPSENDHAQTLPILEKINATKKVRKRINQSPEIMKKKKRKLESLAASVAFDGMSDSDICDDDELDDIDLLVTSGLKDIIGYCQLSRGTVMFDN